jgi:hypothetical protein
MTGCDATVPLVWGLKRMWRGNHLFSCVALSNETLEIGNVEVFVSNF